MTTLHQAVKTLNQRQATEAALYFERATRERVERLENRAHYIETRTQRLEDLLARGFWGRLKWLLLGK